MSGATKTTEELVQLPSDDGREQGTVEFKVSGE